MFPALALRLAEMPARTGKGTFERFDTRNVTGCLSAIRTGISAEKRAILLTIPIRLMYDWKIKK